MSHTITLQPAQQHGFERTLLHEPALVEHILGELPAAEDRERAIIRTDRASVDHAIVRALALAVMGIETEVELTEE